MSYTRPTYPLRAVAGDGRQALGHDLGIHRDRPEDPLLHRPRRRAPRLCDQWQGASPGAGGNWTTHLERDWESPVWRPWLTELSKFNTLIRYDQRANGLSDRNVPGISFEAWLSDLETVVAAAGQSPVALLGASQGAPIAIAYAAKHPQRVSRLVIYGGYARGRLKRGVPAQTEEGELQLRLVKMGWGREDPAFRQFFANQFLPDGTAEQLRWLNELQRISTSPESAARIMEVTNGIDVSALLPRVKAPTLVIHAREDLRVPLDEARLVASTIPRPSWPAGGRVTPGSRASRPGCASATGPSRRRTGGPGSPKSTAW